MARDLRGIGPAPTIAGRSRATLHGNSMTCRLATERRLDSADGAVVSGMSGADLLSASAYLASLNP